MSNSLRDLEGLFAPQERYARLTAAAFRRYGRRIIDLSYANAYDGPDEVVRQALQAALSEDKELAFQYTPYGGRTTTRRLVASRLSEEYGLPFDYQDVIMTPGAMAALNITFRAIFAPDKEVIVLTPCWLDYPLYLRNLGIPFRFVALREDKHFDLTALENAINEKTRGVLFSHPCCPTGVVYSKEELGSLAALLTAAECRYGHPLYLISDEVHRHVIWTRNVFHSPLLIYPRSLSIYSFGKALFLQGQRIGYAAVSPLMPERVELRDGLERCVRMMGFCAPTALMQRAVARLLHYVPALDAVADRQEMVRANLRSYGYEVCDADATFFVYARSPVADDFAFAETLAQQGVLILPSTLFHETGYFRVSVTARMESCQRALGVFEQAMIDIYRHSHA